MLARIQWATPGGSQASGEAGGQVRAGLAVSFCCLTRCRDAAVDPEVRHFESQGRCGNARIFCLVWVLIIARVSSMFSASVFTLWAFIESVFIYSSADGLAGGV